MAKAKMIDRLKLTREKFGITEDVAPAPGAEDFPEPDTSGDVCPMCGHHNLVHESGCVKCLYCSWSKCG